MSSSRRPPKLSKKHTDDGYRLELSRIQLAILTKKIKSLKYCNAKNLGGESNKADYPDALKLAGERLRPTDVEGADQFSNFSFI